MNEVLLAYFWLSVETEFPHLSKKVMKLLVPFTATYLCEYGFSALTLIKSRHWSRLHVGDDLHLFLSTVHPHIYRL